jgi:hypothetical protein
MYSMPAQLSVVRHPQRLDSTPNRYNGLYDDNHFHCCSDLRLVKDRRTSIKGNLSWDQAKQERCTLEMQSY